ncbi:hypothetical protein [Acidocella sp.]|jgi:hypothetical protein|uniref:hypothetical protein n=1 Tax=Acidocella sp. TaxID=50710 RepID=UPI002F4038BE
MPQFTIGENARATMIGPYGTITVPEMTQITTNTNQKRVDVQTLNGVTNSVVVMHGPTGSIEFARVNNQIEQLYEQMFQAWQTGAAIPTGSLTLTINELNNTQTTLHYAAVTFTISDIGNYAPGRSVLQKIEWAAESFRNA